eukprot:12453897-Ditylum_brightwellii.AAC.1
MVPSYEEEIKDLNNDSFKGYFEDELSSVIGRNDRASLINMSTITTNHKDGDTVVELLMSFLTFIPPVGLPIVKNIQSIIMRDANNVFTNITTWTQIKDKIMKESTNVIANDMRYIDSNGCLKEQFITTVWYTVLSDWIVIDLFYFYKRFLQHFNINLKEKTYNKISATGSTDFLLNIV